MSGPRKKANNPDENGRALFLQSSELAEGNSAVETLEITNIIDVLRSRADLCENPGDISSNNTLV